MRLYDGLIICVRPVITKCVAECWSRIRLLVFSGTVTQVLTILKSVYSGCNNTDRPMQREAVGKYNSSKFEMFQDVASCKVLLLNCFILARCHIYMPIGTHFQ